MQARLAAAQLALVGDVVMDERGALEELDGAARGERACVVAAHGLAAQKREHGAHALAAACVEVRERTVEKAVKVGMGALCAHPGVLSQPRLHEGPLGGEVLCEERAVHA